MRFLAALFVTAVVSCSSGGANDGSGPTQTTTGPTFHEVVEPILQKNCQTCHHDGGIAPFSLVTYAEAKKNAALMAEQAKNRTMPPWGQAETAECKPRIPIYHDLSLAQADIDAIVNWSAAGAPEGDPAKAPPAKTFPKNGLASPTDTLGITSYPVAPGNDDFRCFVLDPKLTEDVYLDATNVLPGNSKVVHHALLYVDSKRESLTKVDASNSYACFGGPGLSKPELALAWAPGVPPTEYPAGVGLKIAKDSLLVLQVHYHPTVDTQMDTTKIELRRATAAPSWAANIVLVGNARSAPTLLPGPNDPPSGPDFVIPANVKDHTESMEFTAPAATPEVKIAGVGAHMHWLGKDLKVDIERASPPEGQPASECLLQTPRYDFNWQRGYAFDAPIASLPTLKGGDKLKIRCTYDNTTSNPYVLKALEEKHLTSPVDVRLGEETLDEMCLATFTVYSKL
ncbi:MAG: hypothetical protein ACXVEE_31095 [Polyangiales bacterium]